MICYGRSRLVAPHTHGVVHQCFMPYAFPACSAVQTAEWVVRSARPIMCLVAVVASGVLGTSARLHQCSTPRFGALSSWHRDSFAMALPGLMKHGAHRASPCDAMTKHSRIGERLIVCLSVPTKNRTLWSNPVLWPCLPVVPPCVRCAYRCG
jgi:hypothetical protein